MRTTALGRGGLRRVAALLMAASGASPALGQVPGRAPPADDGFWWRWLLALVLCLGLGAGGAVALRYRLKQGSPAVRLATNPLVARWLAGGLGRAPAPRRVQVLESARASPTLEVCLLRCDGHEYLLAATPHAVTQLSPPGPETAA